MKKIAGIFLSIFLFVNSIFGQVAPIKEASAVLQVPSGGLPMVYELTFTHTAANLSIQSSTWTEPIDISFRGYQTAMIEIFSATLTSGSIGGASYEVCISSREVADITTPINLAAPMIAIKTAAADTLVWASLPAMTAYARYEIPLAGGTHLYLRANGVDRVQRKVRITLR